jgi:PilZ domain
MRKQDRRRDVRVTASGVRARVRPGHRLKVVDVSSSGALVESRCQLRPGSRIDLHLENEERHEMVGANVTRCTVATIDPHAGITYRTALCFTERCDWVRETTTREG